MFGNLYKVNDLLFVFGFKLFSVSFCCLDHCKLNEYCLIMCMYFQLDQTISITFTAK